MEFLGHSSSSRRVLAPDGTSTFLLPVIDFGWPTWDQDPDGIEVEWNDVGLTLEDGVDLADISTYEIAELPDGTSPAGIPSFGREIIDQTDREALRLQYMARSIPTVSAFRSNARYALLIEVVADGTVPPGTVVRIGVESVRYSIGEETFEIDQSSEFFAELRSRTELVARGSTSGNSVRRFRTHSG